MLGRSRVAIGCVLYCTRIVEIHCRWTMLVFDCEGNLFGDGGVSQLRHGCFLKRSVRGVMGWNREAMVCCGVVYGAAECGLLGVVRAGRQTASMWQRLLESTNLSEKKRVSKKRISNSRPRLHKSKLHPVILHLTQSGLSQRGYGHHHPHLFWFLWGG